MKTYPGTNVPRPDRAESSEEGYVIERADLRREIAIAALQGIITGRESFLPFAVVDACLYADLLLNKLEAPTPT